MEDDTIRWTTFSFEKDTKMFEFPLMTVCETKLFPLVYVPQVVTLVASRCGLEALCKMHPDVQVHLASIDELAEVRSACRMGAFQWRDAVVSTPCCTTSPFCTFCKRHIQRETIFLGYYTAAFSCV